MLIIRNMMSEMKKSSNGLISKMDITEQKKGKL